MRVKRPLKVLCIGMVIAAWSCWFMVGCGSQGSQIPSYVIFVLFDISSSTASWEIRQRYLNDFEKILQEMRGGEVLMGDIISENTLATLSYPLNESFPAYNPLVDNPQTHKRKMQRAMERIKEQARKLILGRPSAPRTDLLNAFQAADKVFNGEKYKAVPHKVLVVFSDMIEQSGRYDFAGEKLTPKRIQQIVETLRGNNQLPNLKGVKVWVVGATASTRGGLNPQQIYQIQDFWLAYFKACGADLTKERYATTLLNFDLDYNSEVRR